MKILIVDDNFVNRAYLEALLSDDYELEEAENGVQALEKIESFNPDIVLLDIMMPVMNGFETLHKIRKNAVIHDLVVIMVTAKVEKDDVKKAIKAGANDYIKKPIDQTELFAKLDLQKKHIEQKNKLKQFQVFANIEESMLVAKRLQNALFPDKRKMDSFFPDNFVLNLPKDILSGDFYSIYKQNSKKVLILIDSLGHGVPAAIISTIAHLTISKYIDNFHLTNPIQLLNNIINDFQIYLNQSEDTFTDFGFDGAFCEIDENNNVINFIGAKRNIILIRNNPSDLMVDNQIVEPEMIFEDNFLYNISGSPASVSYDKENYDLKEINYKYGDAIYLFSDGYADHPCGLEKVRISKKGLNNLLIQNQNLPMEQQKLFLYNFLKKCIKDNPQRDDILVVGLKL